MVNQQSFRILKALDNKYSEQSGIALGLIFTSKKIRISYRVNVDNGCSYYSIITNSDIYLH